MRPSPIDVSAEQGWDKESPSDSAAQPEVGGVRILSKQW